MPMGASKYLTAAILLGLTLLTGCWNVKELKDLSLVMAMGVDQTPDQKYRVSFQIVIPSAVASGQMGGGGAANVTPVNVITQTGDTLFEAIRKASEKTPRRLFFQHLRIIVIGDRAARNGLMPFYDHLTRSQEIRLTPQLVVARDLTAEELLNTLTPMEKIPANGVRGILKISEKMMSETLKVEVDQAARLIKSPGNEVTLPGVAIEGKPDEGMKTGNVGRTEPKARIVVRGLGLFKDGKLKRWLDDDEARGTLWLKNKIKFTAMVVSCPGGTDRNGLISFDISGSHTQIKADLKTGAPQFHVKVRQEANLKEAICSSDIGKPNAIMELEKMMSEKTKEEILKALAAAQKEKSDIFGFGDILKRENPKVWKSIKKEWNDRFADCQVDVKVESFYRRRDMKTDPFLRPEEEK